jgi:hypothetical protein
VGKNGFGRHFSIPTPTNNFPHRDLSKAIIPHWDIWF